MVSLFVDGIGQRVPVGPLEYPAEIVGIAPECRGNGTGGNRLIDVQEVAWYNIVFVM